MLHHPVLDDFVFLAENIAEDVLPKQHMPSPGKLLMRILRETETECLKSIYPDLNILLDDLAAAYKNLLEKLYEAGCRYVQFEGVKSILTDEPPVSIIGYCVSVRWDCSWLFMLQQTC